MAYTNGNSIGVAKQTPVVASLQHLFANLNDSPLLAALAGEVRRGPKGYPVKVLWRCVLARYALGIPSTAALIRTLQNSPAIAELCGITSIEGIPHEATFSRFMGRLTKHTNQGLLRNIFRGLVKRSYETLPGFGKRVALDSTNIKAWSNGGKQKKADKEASWAVKQGTHGKEEFTFGYKLHLLVDAEYEMPIGAVVSTGSVHDYKKAKTLLSASRYSYSKFNPEYVIADKGYSGREFFLYITGQHHAHPIIQVRVNQKRLLDKWAKVMETPAWKALYRQRQSVERCFSRLKCSHSLNYLRSRGIKKAKVHCFLSLIAYQAQRMGVVSVLEAYQLPFPLRT